MGGEYTPPSRLLPTFQMVRMARAAGTEKWGVWEGERRGSAMVGRGLAQGDGEEGGDEEEAGDDGNRCAGRGLDEHGLGGGRADGGDGPGAAHHEGGGEAGAVGEEALCHGDERHDGGVADAHECGDEPDDGAAWCARGKGGRCAGLGSRGGGRVRWWRRPGRAWR